MGKWRMLFLLSLATIVFASCSGKGGDAGKEDGKTKPAEKITVALDWTPNTNHTGLYVAKEKGYFKDEGLDVEILMPGEVPAEQLVASGRADFGVSYQEAVTQARIQDVPIVSIAAVIQHNTSGFASLAEKKITSPKDFEGKTYGGWGSPVERAVLASLMKQEGADVDKVKFVNIGDTDFFTAVKKDIDFVWIYYGWTGVEAKLRNVPIHIVYLTDYSEKLDYYTPVLVASEAMIGKNPETVRKFLAAVSKGYRFAIDHPDEAADILIGAVPELDAELVRESQKWLSKKYQDDAERWGEQKLEVWKNYAEWMYENGLLEKPLDAEKAFTNEFLPEE